MWKWLFNSHANKTHFHNKSLALSLILKVRAFGTRKWLIKTKKKVSFFFHFLQTVIYICLHSHSRTHHTCSLFLSMAQVSFSFVSTSLLYNMHTTWPPNKGKYNLNHYMHNKKQLILPTSLLLIDLKSQISQRKINFSGNCEPKIFLQQYIWGKKFVALSTAK